jgi:hypothetical protein
MTANVLWIVGEPGLGKTTLVRRLLPAKASLHGSPKWTVAGRLAAAGHYSGHVFDGADRVPYNGVEDALAFWGANLSSTDLTLFDGDRFSHAGVRGWFHENVFNQRQLCVLVAADAHVGMERRAARGSNQAPTWVKGRVTKARRFWETFDKGDRLLVDAEGDQDAMFSQLSRWLNEQGVLDGEG